jgi:hypothetical protein
MNNNDDRNGSFERVEQAFMRETGSTAGKVWTDVVFALRHHARQSNPSPEEYRHLLFRATSVLQQLARATGRLREDSWTGKVLAAKDLWCHANYRNLVGLKPIKLDIGQLVNTFASYLKLPMQTPYLDWVFVDAYLYHVCFSLKRDIDEDRLVPGDTGTWLPRVESMIANASDEEEAHPILLGVKMTLIRGIVKLIPTVAGVAAGSALLNFDWWKTGTAILAALLAYRIARVLRWIVRIPPRRRGRKFVEQLFSAYGLLDGVVIPTRELRKAVDDALHIWGGERRVCGVEFWSVLEHVCEAYPSVLNRASQ